MLLALVAFCIFCSSTTVTTSAAPVVVPIGHLVYYQDDWRAVEYARQKVFADKILDPAVVEFKYINDTSCKVFAGVVNSATMVYEQNVSLLLGPVCSDEMLSVGQLANADNWNTAVIGFVNIDQSFSNKTIYSTMARTSLSAADSIADVFIKLAKYYSWTQFALVGSTAVNSVRIMNGIKTAFLANGISINIFVQFGPNVTAANISANAQFQRIAKVARIVIIAMESDISTALPVLDAANSLGMTSDEFVFILPWVLHNFRGNNYPWEYDDGSIDAKTKLLYKDVLVVDVSQNARRITDVFDKQFKNATGALSYFPHAYMPEIDAFYLYALALRDAMKATGDLNIHQNGRKVWEYMRNQVYPAAGTGEQVYMDNDAERFLSFTIWQVTDNMTTVHMDQIMDFQARLLSNCTPEQTNATKCLYKDMVKFKELTMIPDEPACGFTGELCDKTVPILIGVSVVVVIVAAIGGFFWYRRWSERKLYQMPWRVPIDEVILVEPGQTSKSLISVDSIRKSRGTLGSVRTRQMGDILQGTWGLINIAVKRYRQKGTINYTRANLEMLFQLRQTSHDNLNGFVGLCFNQRNEFLILWRLCSRGSLQDLLFNDDLKLDTNFQSSFARDVTSGLDYLHRSPVGCHGHLTASNCLVDAHWIVKLTDFGIEDFVDDLMLEQHEISPFEVDDTKRLAKSSSSSKFSAYTSSPCALSRAHL
uniref:guanylate cyclase n=1 Tax=Plectus sambesii TaxID=2011161 RepID=A0A914VYU4_9BILA